MAQDARNAVATASRVRATGARPLDGSGRHNSTSDGDGRTSEEDDDDEEEDGNYSLVDEMPTEVVLARLLTDTLASLTRTFEREALLVGEVSWSWSLAGFASDESNVIFFSIFQDALTRCQTRQEPFCFQETENMCSLLPFPAPPHQLHFVGLIYVIYTPTRLARRTNLFLGIESRFRGHALFQGCTAMELLYWPTSETVRQSITVQSRARQVHPSRPKRWVTRVAFLCGFLEPTFVLFVKMSLTFCMCAAG